MSRQLLCSVALVLIACVGFHPAHASTVVVPDAFSTVQFAIDSGADTVLIREGTYPERPVVDHAVVLQGIGIGQRPRLAGLTIYNSNFWAIPPLLSVSGLAFSGRVEHTTLYVHPRLLQFIFSECSLDSGFYQVQYLDPLDVASLTIRNCRLGGRSSARVFTVVMEADTVDGGVAWDVREPWIQHCWFRGGPGMVAIQLTDEPHNGLTANNRIENYGIGIYVQDGDPYYIEANTIIGCGTGIQLISGTDVRIVDNEIRGCVVGVAAQAGSSTLLRNTIIGAAGPGISALGASLTAEQNVVGECGGDGFVLVEGEGALRHNTIFKNHGSGIVVNNAAVYPMAIQGNIGFGNLGWGLSVVPGQGIDLGCNDWFGNGLGAVNGMTAGATDLSLDPRFCNVDGADVRLDSASPLLTVAGCGPIGALGVGCGVTATLVQRFTAGRVSGGVRVVWEVAAGAGASDVWLERSEAMEGGAWIRPLTERSVENLAVVELDRSAVPDKAYSYRLVALEGRDLVVIGGPIAVEGETHHEFRLTEVAPNPSDGPVRIGFSLDHSAAVEIDVFDVQGRKVATPGRGVWPAGINEVGWDGWTNGERAPAGLYLVRYLYPGGQDRRAIVRVR